MGTFRFNGIASRQISLKRQALPTSEVVERTGYLNGLLKWRGNGGIRWTWNGLTVNYNAQYFSSYKLYVSNASESAITAVRRRQGSTSIPRQMYHDLGFNYQFGENGGLGNTALANASIGLTILNVLDKDPPIIAILSDFNGSYSNYGDPRGRRFVLSLRKRF